MGAVFGTMFLGFFEIEFGFVPLVLRPIRCCDQDKILRTLRVALICFDQEFVNELHWPHQYICRKH